MPDKTDEFLDVVDAAEKLLESLRELRGESEGYTEAGNRLRDAAEKSQVLTDAVAEVLEEQAGRWQELAGILGERLVPLLSDLSQQAEKQATQLAAAAAAVAGQQNQLTLLQQDAAELQRIVRELDSRIQQATNEQSVHFSKIGELIEAQADNIRAELKELTDETARGATWAKRAAQISGFAVLLAIVCLAAVLLQ